MVRKTIYGNASIEYSVDGRFTMKVAVPFGVKGEVILPDYVTEIKLDGKRVENGATISLDGGEYTLSGIIK